MSVVDSWLQAWTLDGGSICVDLSEEPRIDAAVQQWIDMRRDSIVSMSIIGNREAHYLASQIVGWRPSTPEGRLVEVQQEARDIEERRANRSAAGLPFEDPS